MNERGYRSVSLLITCSEGLIKREKEYTRIGKALNDIGGFSLMRFAFYQVSNLRGDHSVISTAWHGIGGCLD